jgi:hypothetical protein
MEEGWREDVCDRKRGALRAGGERKWKEWRNKWTVFLP